MILAFAAGIVITPKTVQAAKKVKLSKAELTIVEEKGASISLKNAGSGKIKWSSSDKSIVKLSKSTGKKIKIKALKEGTATVTATYKKQKYICTVTVEPKPSTIYTSADIPKGVTDIVVPDGMTEIAADTFKNKSVTSITLPKTLIVINDNAFYNCKGLKSIDLPENLKKIGINAFYGTSLEKSISPAMSRR